MRQVLVTGATGLLGRALCALAPPGWSVVATHLRAFSADVPGVVDVTADIRSRPALERLFATYRFDAVVHAAGIASVDYSEQHVEESIESNMGGTRHVAELSVEAGARFVYISTNAVFDGTRAPYREPDPVHPINAYGRIKAACEQSVQATIDRPVIVRPILMYGWPHAMGRPNPVTWIVDSLERGDVIHVVDDVYENPLYNISAASAVWAILERDISGVIHLAGRDSINRYELARLVARVFDLDGSRIRRVSSDHFPEIAPRPKNTTLRTGRMESELGIVPPAIEESLRHMAAQATARR